MAGSNLFIFGKWSDFYVPYDKNIMLLFLFRSFGFSCSFLWGNTVSSNGLEDAMAADISSAFMDPPTPQVEAKWQVAWDLFWRRMWSSGLSPPLMVDRFFMLIYHILLVKGRLATLGGDGWQGLHPLWRLGGCCSLFPSLPPHLCSVGHPPDQVDVSGAFGQGSAVAGLPCVPGPCGEAETHLGFWCPSSGRPSVASGLPPELIWLPLWRVISRPCGPLSSFLAFFPPLGGEVLCRH